MTKKRKNKTPTRRAAEKPIRAPKRGMYLEVVVTDRNGFELVHMVQSFRDITTVGHRAAAQVRNYIRSIPLSPHPAAYSLQVYPRWVENAPPPARQGGAGELEGESDG